MKAGLCDRGGGPGRDVLTASASARALRPDGSAAPPPASPRFQAQTSALLLSLVVQPRGGPPQTLSSPARGASAGSAVK